METVRRVTSPDSVWTSHATSSGFCVMPRLRVMLPYFISPGCLRGVRKVSVPSRYSMGVFSMLSPEHSEKPALVTPSISSM